MPPVGLEPTIVGLKVRCLTNLATGAWPRTVTDVRSVDATLLHVSERDAPPDLELLHDVESQMARVSATIDELSRDDADPAALVSWVPSDQD